MRYEGYEQLICANGHYFCRDVYETQEEKKCQCGAEIAWENSVNETNCDSYGLIPEASMSSLLISPAKEETCNLGHAHRIAEAVYRIPSREETKPWRTYRDFRDDLTKLINP